MPTIVVCVLDAVGPEYLRSGALPRLDALAREGAAAEAGGLSGLVASTAPGHADLIAGRPAREHGVLANRLWGANGEITDRLQVAGPTLLSHCTEAGFRAAVLTGDPDVLFTVRANEAAYAWPSEDLKTSLADPATGYLPDGLVLERALVAIEAAYDVIIMQLQEPDTAAHAVGLDGELSHAARASCDQAVATIARALRAKWDDTILCVLSDHRAEEVLSREPVRLAACLEGLADVIEDGSAAIVRPYQWTLDRVLEAAHHIDGMAGFVSIGAGLLVGSAEPGRVFGRDGPITTRAAHGNITTRPTLAVVAGGHPAVVRIGDRIRSGPPPLTYWANAIWEVLDA